MRRKLTKHRRHGLSQQVAGEICGRRLRAASHSQRGNSGWGKTEAPVRDRTKHDAAIAVIGESVWEAQAGVCQSRAGGIT